CPPDPVPADTIACLAQRVAALSITVSGLFWIADLDATAVAEAVAGIVREGGVVNTAASGAAASATGGIPIGGHDRFLQSLAAALDHGLAQERRLVDADTDVVVDDCIELRVLAVQVPVPLLHFLGEMLRIVHVTDDERVDGIVHLAG